MKKGTKKFLSMVLLLMSMLLLLGQSAFAATYDSQDISQDILKKIQQTNNYIFATIEKTKNKAEKKALSNMSAEEFEACLDRLIDDLIEKTEKKADKLIEEAGKSGVVLEKTYIEVDICGRKVLVDPFYAH